MARRSRPVIFAFAVSPLAASAALAAWVFTLGKFFGDPDDEFGVGATTAIISAASLFSGYLAAIVLGVPGNILFRRIGWIGRRHCFLLGTVIGCAAAALLLTMGVLAGDYAGSKLIYAIAGGAVVTVPPALVMGVVFTWLIRRAGPDIDKIAATFD